MNRSINIGDIVVFNSSLKKYRVISTSEESITLCRIDTSKLDIVSIGVKQLFDLCNSHVKIEHEEGKVFEPDELSETMRYKYEENKQIIKEIKSVYGPDYVELNGKKHRPELVLIMGKYNISKKKIWKLIREYLQSGLTNYALVDRRAFGVNKDKQYEYSKKPGRPSKYFKNIGIIVDDTVKSHFAYGLSIYKSSRVKNIIQAFNEMNCKYYMQCIKTDTGIDYELLPESERPTYTQFYNYVKNNLTEQEKDKIKTSAQEQRNNKRILTSDSLYEVLGPGDLVEIDACEADISLVSSINSEQTVGRPIVYFMIDVYTRAIIAMSVTFENNSVLGLTSLLLNLCDDKIEYCRKFGVDFDNESMWPSNIIPSRIRCDRGSEFKSNEFTRICNELGIDKELVSGGSGSLKGIVEQSFHQMHNKLNSHVEKKGLIEKRYDSNHHLDAALNIKDYTKMVINFVFNHNQRYFKDYPLTVEMRKNNVRPIPIELWEYGVATYSNQTPITNKNHYLYTIMNKLSAKISRKGIEYKGLYYSSVDPELTKEMFNASNKRKPFEIRMDKRDVGHVYYMRDNNLFVAELNGNKAGIKDIDGCTLKEYEILLEAKKRMDAKGRIHNEQLDAYTHANLSNITDAIQNDIKPKTKNMRKAREIEKQAVNSGNNIHDRLENEEHDINTELVESRINENISITSDKKYNNFDEACDDTFDE